jgi:two-component system nitrogen regulation response regulator GlnG
VKQKKSRVTKVSPEAMAVLTRHKWPGNVRELENAIYRSAVIAQTDAILVKDLPADICGPGLPEPITTAPGAGAIEAPFDAARAALPESVTVASARASAVSLAAGANPPMLTLEVAFDFLYASLSKEGELMQFRIERELARRALVASGGDASMAAKHLGLTKATLAKRLSE